MAFARALCVAVRAAASNVRDLLEANGGVMKLPRSMTTTGSNNTIREDITDTDFAKKVQVLGCCQGT